MKRKIFITVTAVLLALCLCACGKQETTTTDAEAEAIERDFGGLALSMQTVPSDFGLENVDFDKLETIELCDRIVIEDVNDRTKNPTVVSIPVKYDGKLAVILSLSKAAGGYTTSIGKDYIELLKKVGADEDFQMFQDGYTLYLASAKGVWKLEGQVVSEVEKDVYDKFFGKIDFDYENTVNFANKIAVNDGYTDAARRSIAEAKK